MPKIVDFKGLATIEFPDDWSNEQIESELKSKDQEFTSDITARLKEEAVAQTDLEQGSKAEGFRENLGSAVGSAYEAAGRGVTAPAVMSGRAIEIFPPGAFQDPMMPDMIPDSVRKEWDAMHSQRAVESPEDRVRRIESNPLVQLGARFVQHAQDVAPTLPGAREGFFSGAVPQGIGSTVGGIAGGMVGGPGGAFASMWAAEASDAYDEEMSRQLAAGETPDPEWALQKATLYGTYAAAIESKLGAGRIAKRLKQAFFAPSTGIPAGGGKSFLRSFIKDTLKEAGMGYTEEGLQRAGEDLIVHGETSMDNINSEGLPGAFVQGAFGVAANVGKARSRRPVLNPRTKATVDDMGQQAGPQHEPNMPGAEPPPPGAQAGPEEQPGPQAEPGAQAAPEPTEEDLTGLVAGLTGGEVAPEPITGVDEAMARQNAPDETKPSPADIPVMRPGTAERDPIPEDPAAIAEQIRLTADPASTKAATLITPGESVPEDLPEGLMVVKTKHGPVIFNPDKIDPQDVAAAGAGETFDGTILGMADNGKTPVESPIVVTTSTEAAKNVVTEITPPTQEAIQKAVAAQQAAVPGGTTEVKPAIEVARERAAAAQQSPEPQPSPAAQAQGEMAPSVSGGEVAPPVQSPNPNENPNPQAGGTVGAPRGRKARRGQKQAEPGLPVSSGTGDPTSVAAPGGDVLPDPNPQPGVVSGVEGGTVNEAQGRPGAETVLPVRGEPKGGEQSGQAQNEKGNEEEVLKNTAKAAPEAPVPGAAPLRAVERDVGKPEASNEPKTSTTKALKVQKEYLLEAVSKAIDDAPESVESEDLKAFKAAQGIQELMVKYAIPTKQGKNFLNEKERQDLLKDAIVKSRWRGPTGIVFDVPGDGVFTLVNDKPTLKKFRDIVKKRWPKGTGAAAQPGLASIAEPSIPKPVSIDTREDRIEILAPFTSEDPNRAVITRVAHSGGIMVATDGRRMAAIPADKSIDGTKQYDPISGDEVTKEPEREEIKTTHPDGRITTEYGSDDLKEYPNYKQVIPRDNIWRAKVPVAPLLKMLRGAIQIWKGDDKNKKGTHSVGLYMDPKGNFGVKAGDLTFGSFESGITSESRVLGAFSPEFLMDALEAAARTGNQSVWISTKDELVPMGIMGDGFVHVLMPMRMNGGAKQGVGPAEPNLVTPEARRESGLDSRWSNAWELGKAEEKPKPEAKTKPEPKPKTPRKKKGQSEYRMPWAPPVNIWEASDAELEDLLNSPSDGRPGEAAPTVTYRFKDQAEFNTWMDARFAENDLEGMAHAFADVDARTKIGWIKANRAADQTKKDVIQHLATGAPLPAGWSPVARTTPRPMPPSMPQPRPGPTGSGPGQGQPPRPPARPAQPAAPPRTPTPLRKFNITAQVQFLRKFGKNPRINRLLKRAYGRFITVANNVELKKRLLWDKTLAQRVLAHEIGHFIDLAIAPGGTGRQFGNRWQPLRSFKGAIGDKIALRNAARSLSRQWRGPFQNGDPYRDSADELFADVLSALLNDPEWVNQNHALLHDTFQKLLTDKPDFRAAYRSVEDYLRTGTMPEEIASQLDASFAASRKKLAEGEKTAASSLWGTAKVMTVSPWNHAFDIEGRPREVGDRIIDRLEAGDTFAAKRIGLMRDDFLQRVQPLLDRIRGGGEIARDIFAEHLVANRVINERRAAGAWIEAHPDEAVKMLEEVFKAVPHVAAKWRGRLQALGPSPTGEEVYDLAAKIFREVHDLGEREVARVERAISRSRLGIEGSPALAAFNVRGMLLNPSGLTPETAQQLIDHNDATLTPDERKALREAAREFFDIAHPVMVDAHAMGLISDRVFREIVEPNRYNYVPFAVADFWEGHVGAGIKPQSGTTRDIIDPVVALQQRMASMLHWQQRQGQVMALLEAYDRSGSPVAPTRELDHVNEILHERKQHQGDDVSRLVLWRNGSPWLVELPNDPGKSFEKAMERRLAHEEFARLYMLSGWSHWNHAVLSLYTVLNPAFVAFRNPIRDIRTTMLAVGFRNTGRELTKVGRRWRLARNYAEAAFGGKLDPEVRAMIEDGTLPPPHIAHALAADPIALHEMLINGSILAGEIRMGRANDAPSKFEKWTESKLRPWIKFAALLEALPKIMARDAATRGGFRPEVATWIAKRAGIPNPGVGGTYSSFLESFFPWTRVHTQGLRRTLDISRDPTLNRRFAARFAITEIAPRVGKYLLAAGAVGALASLGDDDDSWVATLGEFFRRASPYKMAIDDLIPLGFRDPRTGDFHSIFSTIGMKAKDIPKHWEAVSFRLPASEEGKLWGSMVYEILAGITPDKTSRRGQGVAENLWDWGTSQAIPSFSPPLEFAAQMAMMLAGRNPKDSFRGSSLANEELFKAGWGEGRGQAVLGAAYRQLGLPGEVLSLVSQTLGMDPRAIEPTRKSVDPIALLAKIPLVKAMLSFDNYEPFREEAYERKADDQIRSRAKLLMTDDVRKLYDFYYGHVADQKKMDERDTALFEIAKSWHTRVWGDKRSPGKMYPKAKSSVGEDGTAESRATVKRDLETLSDPYVRRFQETTKR